MTDDFRVVVLGGAGETGAIHPILCERLEHAGVSWRCGLAPHETEGTAALALRWGVDIAGYLEPGDPRGCLRAEVREAIRSAFRDGTPILAPCVSFVVVVDALSDIASAADLTMRAGPPGVVTCAALKAIGSRRPFIGQDHACIRAWLDAAIAQARAWHEARREHHGALP